MNRDAISAAVGAPYEMQPLKGSKAGWAALCRKLRFEGAARGLAPYRIDTADGRSFKLLVADDANRQALRSLLIRYEAVASLDCAPRLLWHDERALLLDFIDGDPPDMASAECAAAFGRNLAQIHNLGVESLAAATVLRSADKYIEDLVDAGLLQGSAGERLRGRLASQLPDTLRTSADYADVQPGNFRLEANGRLRFIDVGGFQIGRLTGEAFFGHPGSAKLDPVSFTAAYKAAGGPEDIFTFRDEIMALSDLRRGARLAIWADGAKFLQPGRARSFRARAHRLVARLVGYASAQPQPTP